MFSDLTANNYFQNKSLIPEFDSIPLENADLLYFQIIIEELKESYIFIQ